jgi:hypothetical protein
MEYNGRLDEQKRGGEKRSNFEASRKRERTGAALVGSDLNARAIPDLGESLKRHNVRVKDQPVELIGLLGGDFLKHATLTYMGSKGRIEILLDLGSFPSMPQPTLPPALGQ